VTPERWRRINELFHAALEFEPEQRGRFLQHAAADAELIAEVQSLLAKHDSSPGFLETPAWGVAAHMILDDPAESLVGRDIGPYRVLEELGRGGMGIVYAAKDLRLDRTVALKALPPEFTRDPVRRERLLREARAAAALSHPAVATVHALEELDGNLYMVSELVRGRTLREELQDGPLPPGRLLDTLIDIADGLAAAHALNIVHRDVKPENIMRCSNGRIKILDFGLARTSAPDDRTTLHLTQEGMAVGTPKYMAPEQKRAGATVDARADVFAFGLVGWELATGRHLLGLDDSEVLVRMTELLDGGAATELSQTLPIPGLNVILRRCLSVDPRERYASAELVLRDLKSLRSDERPATGSAVQPRSTGFWWWQFHQIAIAIVIGSTPIAVWFVRRWAQRPYGLLAFFAVLALATTSVTLRLNLLFTSRVYPAILARHRRRHYPWMAAAEAILALLLLGCAALVAGPHDAVAAVLVALAIVTIASLGIIEPVTTAAAGVEETGSDTAARPGLQR
jgi:hypothetical protein